MWGGVSPQGLVFASGEKVSWMGAKLDSLTSRFFTSVPQKLGEGEARLLPPKRLLSEPGSPRRNPSACRGLLRSALRKPKVLRAFSYQLKLRVLRAVSYKFKLSRFFRKPATFFKPFLFKIYFLNSRGFVNE